MGLLVRSKSAAVALVVASGWGLSGWGHSPLSADDKFIMQPTRHARATPASDSSLDKKPVVSPMAEAVKLDKATLVKKEAQLPHDSSRSQPTSLTAPPASLSSARIMNPKSTVAASGTPVVSASPTAVAPNAARDSSVSTSTSTLSTESTGELVLSDAPQTVAPPAATTAVEPSETGQLRWLARGALPSPTHTSQNVSTGPVEFSNPSYTTPTPESPTSTGFTTAPALEFATIPSTVSASSPWTAQPADTTKVEPESSKKILASLVSSQIIAERPGNEGIGRAIAPIDAPPGWQAIGAELSQRIASCESLLNRKAYFSAREEAEGAMLYLVRVLDLMSNRYTSEPAWFAASKAMFEAEDFSSAQRLTSDSDILRRIILSHETPVLKDADVATLAPLAAAQHYRQYAETKLTEAAQGHPWAAEVAYALGRTYQAQADVAEDGSAQSLRWKAVTLYRSARAIAPYNSVATNQLGYVLLQMDRAADAREALVASINANPSLSAYENLVEASRRLSDPATGNWAMQQAMVLRSTAAPQTNIPPVVEVDPRTFAALSLYSIGPNPQHSETAQQPYRTAAFPSNSNSYR